VRRQPLAAGDAPSSAAVAAVFDMQLRALRRDRAARRGPELFLFERAFDDCLDRLSIVQRDFDRALLIGCPDPNWPARLSEFAREVDVCDPGNLFAQAAGGEAIIEDMWMPEQGAHDLILSIGTLDTVNDLPRALLAVRHSMQADALFIGAMSGADTLPQLRSAMRVADQVSGAASPHVHPRIEASMLATLLSAAGFLNPVVDVDRVQVSYRSLGSLVEDLRRMAGTNILASRARTSVSKRAAAAAAKNFSDQAEHGRTVETFQILHFACWTEAA
jgi:NADH dehydrogenase [ubiquinone] 1 alpha subcomplex assembly factor 5